MSIRDWWAASDPGALGFVGGILYVCVLLIVLDVIRYFRK